jgi:CHAT domain/SIR2-like domain
VTGYDLQIALHRRDGVHWAIELGLDDPSKETENALIPQGSLAVTFDFDKLAELAQQDDMKEYGRLLGRSLFTSEINGALGESRAIAHQAGQPLRVRLFIGPSAPELHGLRWEAMRDPEDDQPLVTDETVLFSRFLSSRDWRSAGAGPKSDTRALVAVANPTGLGDYESDVRRLDPIDVAGEIERARAGMRALPTTVLARASGESPVTIEALVRQLRRGFDVLYLVCHGFMARGEPLLLLENESGGVGRVTATDLVDAVRHLERPPRLVILASCQSAGAGDASSSCDGGALAPLGPRLAEAGVPAVLAMQGDISMKTIEQFMPVFFSELDRDGRIDRATAVARWAVRNRPDWWAPTLYMRLKSGRLWYSPGFVSGKSFDMWPGLVRYSGEGVCTPLLGLGLTDSLIGSRQQIAKRWAATFRFPLEPQYQDDLAHVAQYLAVKYGDAFLPHELGGYLRRELDDRYGDALAPEVRSELYDRELDDVVTAVADLRRDTGAFDPFQALADIPFPLYLTTHPMALLEHALERVDRAPHVGSCPWNEELAYQAKLEDMPAERPTAASPFVYHLFGRLGDPTSLVLTEDNYLDYLMGITANRKLIPEFVVGQLAQSALLFLGFQLDEWDFRVLFRLLMNQEGQERRKGFKHVAVQIDPEEGRTIEPDRARRYLESYFGENRIDIYWGRTDDFVRELHAAWMEQRR